jgi:hypothetical protein
VIYSILHTLSAIGIEASGPCYSVPALCESLIAAGVPTKLAVLDWVPGIEAPSYVEPFRRASCRGYAKAVSRRTLPCA